jgi:hypothetical protein
MRENVAVVAGGLFERIGIKTAKLELLFLNGYNIAFGAKSNFFHN